MSTKSLNVRLRHAIRTESEWQSSDPILLEGEIGFTSDKGLYKVGNGTSKWSELSYNLANSLYGLNTSITELNYMVGVTSKVQEQLDSKAPLEHTHSEYVNQNAFSNIAVGDTTIKSDSVTDTLTLVAGDNITLTPDATNDKITIAAKDTTYNAAGSALGLVKSGGDVTISSGVITVKDDSHNHVISNVDGLQSALDGKVPTTRTVNGKALSANITLSASDVGADTSGSASSALSSAKVYVDTHINNTDVHITSDERSKLANIEAGAQKNTVTGVKGSSESSYRTGNINITKANIGLGNVNNTSDTNKPVSTAQQAAIDSSLESAKSYTDDKIDIIMGEGVSDSLNTIGKLSQAIEAHKKVTDALDTAVKSKANQSDLTTHTGNTTAHITSTERTNWNDANSKKHTHSNKTTLDNTTASYTTEEKTKLAGIENGANAYTHLTYTARTGVPTANQKPSFGGTFTVSQPVSDSTGHITAINSRTITIPNTIDGKMNIKDSNGGTGVGIYEETGGTILLGYNNSTTAGTVVGSSNNETVIRSSSSDNLFHRVGSNNYKILDTGNTSNATTSISGLMSTSDKIKLDSIESGAQVNTITGIKGNSESSYRTGKVNITKANIGLGNVDNTSDTNKPVSTAQKTAIDTSLASAKQYTDTAISNLINSAPTTLDTLGEIAEAMKQNEDVVDALEDAIGTKANASDLTAHTENSDIHFTASERTKLSGIAEKAEVNQNAFSNVKVGSTTVSADTKTDTLTLEGSNITITPDATNDKITFTVASGSTSAKGIVQLTNSTSSTSTTTAATPNSVKSAYDLANTAKTAASTAQSTADGKADKEHIHEIADVTDLQSALDGKAASSHGTHVSYSSTAPVMDGAASVGSASTVARSDHKHPTDTSRAAKTDFDTHVGDTVKHITSTERTNWGTAYTHSQSAHAPSNAEVNQNAFSNVKIGDTTIAADSKTDTLTLVAGSNVTLTPDATNDKITITAKDTVYTHPSHTSKSSGLYKITVDSTGHVSAATSVTKADITALGIPSSDTNTHYTSKNVVSNSSSATSNTTSALTNGNVYLVSVENGAATSAHKISGAGATIVTTDTNGNIVITSTDTNTDTNTTYTLSKSGSTITLTGSDGSTTSVTDSNTTYSNASLGQGYGTCSTAEATIAKVVTLSNYALATGGVVAVKFTYAVPANATMNINSKGAKSIYYKGSAIVADVIQAGDTGIFIYNGSQYHLLSVDRDNDTVTTVSTTGSGNAITSLTASNGKITATKGSTFLTQHPTITINEDTTSTSTATHGGKITMVDSITRDANGHVTKINTKTVTLPTDKDTTYGAAGSSLGLVKTGGDVTIADGIITINDDSHNHTISNVDNLQTELNKKLAIRPQNWNYNNLGSYYCGGSTPTYIRITFATNMATIWTMLYAEISIRQSYSSNLAGKLYISGYHSNTSPYTWKLKCVTNATLSSTIKVYAKDQYIYIAGVTSYGAISVDKVLTGDTINSTDLSSITIDTVTSLPDEYATAIMVNTLTTENVTGGASTVINDNLTASRALISNSSGKVAVSDITTTELGYLDGVTSNLQTQLDGKSPTNHTHNYAGSSSAGGAATSANKLNTNAGSTTQPVYFSNGIPVKTTYTLGKSVPSDAVFTDTHYTSKNVVGSSTATSNTTSALTNGNVYLNSVENDVVTSTHKISGSGATTVTSDASGNIIVSSTNTTYSGAGSSLGLVKSGGDVTISSGVITVNDDSHNHVISNIDNLQTTLDTINEEIDGSIKSLSVSGKTITYTKNNGTTGTITTQDTNTDVNVKQTSSSTANYRALLMGTSHNATPSELATEETGQVYKSTNIVASPSTGEIKATKFTGSGASLTSLNASNITSGTLSSDRLPTVPISKGGTGATTAAGALTNLGLTATATELNYTDGVTSNIQTQLNTKTKGESKSATTEATAGWYRIATSDTGINRCIGTFEIEGTVSGNHTTAIISAGTMYGVAKSSMVQVLHCGHYSGSSITKARIVYHTTYSGNYAYLEVYNPNAKAIKISVKLIGGTGWSLVTPSTVGSVPSGYSSKEVTLSNGTIVADTFSGSLSGNASTATKATQDASGNTITSTYATKTELDTAKSNLQTSIDSKAASSHTHNYAGSSSSGGSATSAVKLDTSAGSATQPVYFSGGKPVACTYSLNKTVPSDAKFTDTTYSAVTTSANGLMSASDKSKLDGIESGANKYSLPTASSSTLGGVKTTSTVTSTSGLTACPIISGVPYYKDTNTTYSTATTSADGLMTSAMVTKLNGITDSADSVSFSRSLTSGTKIGTITINGTATDLYCQTNTNTDTKVKITANTPTSATIYYPIMHTSTSGTVEVTANTGTKFKNLTGTASAEGYNQLTLGNSTASGSDGNSFGQIALYSSSSGYHMIVTASTTSAITHTLPATSGTILNTGTTSVTQTLTSGTEVGKIKINGTTTTLYAPTNTDTKNTAGSTDSSSKLFLIGATSQAANPQTYSHDTCYVGTDGHLYSNSVQVVNLSGSQALTNKTYNGYTLAAACAKAVTDSSSASAISTGTSLVTERDVYYGLPTINGAHTYTSSTNIYAPTSVGTSGYVLKSGGSGAPSWVAQSTLSVGSALNDSEGQQINITYIKDLSVSGKTITYTKGDGTTGTITTQDTNTTYSNFVKSGSGAKAGLVPAPSTTAGTTKYLREDCTWATPPDTTYDLSGYATKASPIFTGSISLGRENTSTIGTNSFAVGTGVYASGSYSHAEGDETNAEGLASHAEGQATSAYGDYSHAEGQSASAYGISSHAEGQSTNASGKNSHAEGYNNTAEGDNSHAEGGNTKASNSNAHAEGGSTTASGTQSHAEGYNTIASGNCAHSAGSGTIASGAASHAGGYGTEALDHQYAIGHSNDTSVATKGTYSGTGTGTSFVIGNGTASAKSNAFRVNQNGQTYAKGAYNSTGADYAEFFEWADGNPNSEDRVGYFVTFDEENPGMIRKANHGEYLLGIVSGNPCVIGNSDESWLGRYCFDEFGRYIYEEIEENVEDKGRTTTKKVLTYKLNSDFNPKRVYIPRSERPEWDYIGMMGVLSVYDDGTCIIGGYCTATDGGIATLSERGIGTYRVLQRINTNIIKVVFSITY